jgi:predicted transcriptional regulator
MTPSGNGSQPPASTPPNPRWRSPLGLGPLETAIMHALWTASGPVRIQDIRNVLDYHRPVTYTTIATIAGNLCAKGMACRQDGYSTGRPGQAAWWYRPVRSHDEHTGDVIAALLGQCPSPATALAHALATTQAQDQLGTFSPSATAGQQAPAG